MTAGLAMAPWVADQARLLLAQNGHAWLLHGPSGLGQYDLALSLASAWLCDQPSGEGACGHCGSCHAIDVRTHADLAVLMPETVLIDDAVYGDGVEDQAVGCERSLQRDAGDARHSHGAAGIKFLEANDGGSDGNSAAAWGAIRATPKTPTSW